MTEMVDTVEFVEFKKIPRLTRGCIITEKIDGTNGQIYIGEDGTFKVGSRNRWLSEEADNFGFFKWAQANKEQLMLLGPGRHYGEWWGNGIQRTYSVADKRFSLFNTSRWADKTPPCCLVVPVLYDGIFSDEAVNEAVRELEFKGSKAAPGFAKPEGVVVFHVASRSLFKKTIEKDSEPKGNQ